MLIKPLREHEITEAERTDFWVTASIQSMYIFVKIGFGFVSFKGARAELEDVK